MKYIALYRTLCLWLALSPGLGLFLLLKNSGMPGEIILYETAIACARYCGRSQTGSIEWLKQGTADDFWEAGYALMRHFEAGELKYCVFYYKKGVKMPQEHAVWLKHLALPDAAKAGLMKAATVIDANCALIAAKYLCDKIFRFWPVPHKYFCSKYKMERWLYS
jgi:hypothetical protein